MGQEGFQSRRRGWLIVVPVGVVAVVVLGLAAAL